MIIRDVPSTVTDWRQAPIEERPGETGRAMWQTLEIGNIRVRMVEYSPGYSADHWCTRGHVLLVTQGELIIDLKDGRTFVLGPGMTYQVASDAEPHRPSTRTGAALFIVD